MDNPASSHNVYPLKPTTGQADLLNQVRTGALQHLPTVLTGVLAKVDDALFDLVQKSFSTFEQQQFFDAMRELRRQRGGIEQRYREHFIAAFVGLEKRKPVLARYAQPGETSSELSLLNEDELEEQLASEQVAQAIERRHGPVLAQLDQQLGRLCGGLEINNSVNPLGPGHLAEALRSGLRGCDLASSARLVLFKLYEQALLPALTPFYNELVKRLNAAGLGGAVPKPSTPASTPQPTSPAEPRGDAAPSSPREESQVRDDLFTALHGLLQDYRAAQRATSYTGSGTGSSHIEPSRPGAAPMQSMETLSVLSLLQRELPASVHAAVADPKQSLAGQIKRELMAQAERMGVGTPGAPLSPPDEDAIDLVGMLFEVLLNERKFQDQIRRLFTQMIVPFTKVAMLDRRMFMHKTHPARRMLNSVAEACDGNSGETALERELLDRVQGLVDRLVADFNEDLAIFETLQEEFASFLEQHRKRVELAERRAAEAQRGRERLEQARAVASMELAMLLGAREAPPAVDAYLRRYWTHHLALVILRDGADSTRFAQARASGDQLWRAMVDCESGHPRTESLAPIMEPVLLSSGVMGQAAAEIVQTIEALLDAMHARDHVAMSAAVLPASALAGMPEATRSEDAPHASPPRSADAAPFVDNVVKFAPPSAAGAAAPIGDSMSAQGPLTSAGAAETTSASAEGASESTDPAAADSEAVVADPADVEKIRKLEVGNWVEMVGADGVPQPAKLSWVSPISNRLLFVNRRGMRVCAASAEELAVMLKQGKLSLREIDTAFERAMTQVLGKLRETQIQRASA